MYGYGAWGALGSVVIGIVALIFVAGVAALVVLLLRETRRRDAEPGSRPPSALGDDPERILGQRFARGEIDEAEYKARLDVLRRAR